MNRSGLIVVATLLPLTACLTVVGAAAQDRAAFLAKQTTACPGCDLRGASLDRRDLTGADLSGADLREPRFRARSCADKPVESRSVGSEPQTARPVGR